MENKENYYQKELQDNELYFLSEFFKALGTTTRLRILFSLMEGEACVSELPDRLESSQSLVSHQLNLLKYDKFVQKCRKDYRDCPFGRVSASIDFNTRGNFPSIIYKGSLPLINHKQPLLHLIL